MWGRAEAAGWAAALVLKSVPLLIRHCWFGDVTVAANERWRVAANKSVNFTHRVASARSISKNLSARLMTPSLAARYTALDSRRTQLAAVWGYKKHRGEWRRGAIADKLQHLPTAAAKLHQPAVKPV